MSKLTELLARLHPGSRAADEADEADEEEEQEDVAGDVLETEGMEELVEAVTETAETVARMAEDRTQVVEAIQLLDGVLEEIRGEVADLRTIVHGLAGSEVERLQRMTQNDDWYRSLFVASRDGDHTDDDDLPETVPQAPSTGTSGSLLDPIIHPGS